MFLHCLTLHTVKNTQQRYAYKPSCLLNKKKKNTNIYKKSKFRLFLFKAARRANFKILILNDIVLIYFPWNSQFE